MQKRKLFNQSGVGAIVLLIILSLIAGSVVLLKKNSSKPTVITPTLIPSQEVVNNSNEPILSFSTDPLSVEPGQSFDLILKLNPMGKEFHAFEFYAGYDPAEADFQDEANLSANISSSYQLIISAVDTVNPRISVVGTKLGSSFSGSEDVEIARVKMKKKPEAQGNLTFSWLEDTKLGNKLTLQKLNANF